MSLFDPEKKKQKREELERKRKELEMQRQQKKVGKTLKKSDRSDLIKPTQDIQNRQISRGLSRPNRSAIKPSGQQKVLSFAERLEQKQTSDIPQRQLNKEILSRLSETDVSVIKNNMIESSDLFTFYKTSIQRYAPEVLVALRCVTKSEQVLFDYIIKNNLEQELYQGKVELFDNAEVTKLKESFKDFIERHPEFKTSEVIAKKDPELPRLYILGTEQDFELVKAMSLDAPIFHINLMSDLEIFERDERKKAVILFRRPNPALGKPFKEISKVQQFKLYPSFQLGSSKASNEITPFNRKNLIRVIGGDN